MKKKIKDALIKLIKSTDMSKEQEQIYISNVWGMSTSELFREVDKLVKSGAVKSSKGTVIKSIPKKAREDALKDQYTGLGNWITNATKGYSDERVSVDIPKSTRQVVEMVDGKWVTIDKEEIGRPVITLDEEELTDEERERIIEEEGLPIAGGAAGGIGPLKGGSPSAEVAGYIVPEVGEELDEEVDEEVYATSGHWEEERRRKAIEAKAKAREARESVVSEEIEETTTVDGELPSGLPDLDDMNNYDIVELNGDSYQVVVNEKTNIKEWIKVEPLPPEAEASYGPVVITHGGNYYDEEGYYTDREGNRLPDEPKAPFKPEDQWALFYDRDDMFEIQQAIMAAGGPVPVQLGYWDEDLAEFMWHVLAEANDSMSWMIDEENGLEIGFQWETALQTYTDKYKQGTDMATLMSELGYTTISYEAPDVSEQKSAVDSIFSKYGLKPTDADYASIGEYFVEISKQSVNREAEILLGKEKLSNIVVGGMEYLSEIPSVRDKEAYERFSKARAEGRLQQSGNGWYIVPDPESVERQLDLPKSMKPMQMLDDYVQSRYSGKIEQIEDRTMDRNNIDSFRDTFLTVSREG